MALLRLILLALFFSAAPVAAQLVLQTRSVDATLSAATAELRRVDAAFDNPATRSEDHAALRDRAAAVRGQGEAAVAELTPELALIDARIAELGPRPVAGEPRDITAQRAALTTARSRIDSAIKRGRLLSVEAAQLADEISGARAQRFGERVLTRGASPLSPALWHAIWRDLPQDWGRLARFGETAGGQLFRATRGQGPWPMLAGALLAVLLAGPIRLRLRQAGRRFAVARAPGSRARRTGLALWFLLVGTMANGLAAVALVQGLSWAGALSQGAQRIAAVLVPATFLAAFIMALSACLLLRNEPSWRLLPIGDRTATLLRPFGGAAAAVVLADLVWSAVNRVIGVSDAARVASQGILAMAYAVLIAATLVTIGRLRAAHELALEAAAERGEAQPGPQGAAMAMVLTAAWGVLGIAVVAALVGYVSLGLFLVRETVWIAIVAGATTLLLAGADDLLTILLSRDSRLGRAATAGVGVRASTVEQIGVLLSAVVRLILLLLALGAVLVPFGSDIGSMLDAIGSAAAGITVGEMTISPGAILRAVVVLFLGLAAVRGIGRWLESRYLPATALDAGARNSVATVARYVGIILAGLWSMASLGIGVERIALVLSALSVGIGFGLQAITQNFVSGLILLAERPVKIGDWVRMADQEGDVKKISVRATEIQIADGSTLIVPNSELITKSIRNMTLASPIGRVQIQFAVPVSSDVGAIRDMLMAIFHDHEQVLDTPAPVVFIDGLAAGQVQFNSFANVASPRVAYSVRSELLFTMLERFKAAGVHLQPPAQEVRVSRGDRAGPVPA